MNFESRQGETPEDTIRTDKVESLKMDVDYLKSIDFILLLEAANDVDAPRTSEIPANTIVDESEGENDEEQIEVREDNSDLDIADQVVLHIS